MQFGVFDQNDRGRYPLAEQYDKRLELIAFYDRAGFRTYHMSEHHSTPLSLAPSPSVFLAAVARSTKRLRFGPLVYVLPMHHPLRLAEEICMLDHLAGGRLEVGVGRGASPHELRDFGVDPELAPAIYVEAYNVIKQALTRAQVDFAGAHFRFEAVPIEMWPLQSPHPPFWYVAPTPESAVWAARNGLNVVCGGSTANARMVSDRVHAEWTLIEAPPAPERLIGINRFVVAADTDAAAMALGRRAWPVFQANFMKLWVKHGTLPRYTRLPPDFDTVVEHGAAIVGSPGTLRRQVLAMAEAAGATYFISQFSLGDLTHEEVMRSAGIFAAELLAG